MLAMRPIEEPDVIDLLNGGRFEGALEGYVVLEGPRYLGHTLFWVEKDEVKVLDAEIEDPAILDGAVRACLAAGENRGAKWFEINRENPALAHWEEVFCKNIPRPRPIETLWGTCGS
ncbi:hypothetical protein LJC49_08585 [Ruminococcaceae bacterium OttesenSCG-928-I18]|nr:hypothetical protein [Ruminococcaceae bacterium OttesenSCG-928-I18]